MRRSNLSFFVVVSITAMLLLFFQPVLAQEGGKPQKIKKGWTVGPLPAISFNSDLGFQYGALVNFHYFGDGSTYPKYMHSVFAEWSRYTKGSGINRLFYDSEYLIPGIRFTADLNYYTDQALDFYGFNGYDAVYNPEWEDDSDTTAYKSRMFYNHKRSMFRFLADFQGGIIGRKLRWAAGIGVLHCAIAPVDIARLNKGKDEADKLPDIPGLYEKYIEWGIIGEVEKDGGWANNLKAGIIWDTRDFEPNPMKGMWSEAVIFLSPRFVNQCEYGFAKISLTHRQYFTLIKDKLSFAYRLNYQGTIAGSAPFYIQPYVVNSFNNSSLPDGIGGAKSVRGMIRNRVVGDATAFGNAEFRWKVWRTVVLNQNFYIGINAFVDAGQVLKKMDIDTLWVPEDEKELYFSTGDEFLHTTAGLGLRLVLNENFIVALDWGKAFDKRDGDTGLYIGLNYLF
ncbi:MAG TPA: hypothetical protein P5228_09405 [Bacteroidales bacterium]|nr:hypothetical protein [Bacteroidales bacterium]HRZ48466.1 hypothetical protein [Bacteroidales bacterium]